MLLVEHDRVFVEKVATRVVDFMNGGKIMLEIAVCDDDVNDLERITNILHSIFTEQKIRYELKSFVSADEMVDRSRRIDIGVLDIVMEKQNGIDLGKKLRERFPKIKLIYTTNYEQYVMRAVNEVHTYAFLCKPIDEKKMNEQILDILSSFSANILEKEFYKVTDSQKKEYSSVKLRLEDIMYFTCIKRQRKVSIILENETYEYECIFGNIVDEMEKYDFAVNCRGSLVNLRHVVKIKGSRIYLDNGEELSLSQRRISDFREKMNSFLQKDD